MAANPRRIVREWLDAERAGRTEEADRSFRLVTSALPRFRPSPQFADAVLARAALRPAGRSPFVSWWLRGLVAAALLSAGALVVSLSAGAWLSALVASVRAVAWGCDHALAAVGIWVTGALGVWSGLAHASAVLGGLLAGPGAILVLTLNLAVAAAALTALCRLMPLREN